MMKDEECIMKDDDFKLLRGFGYGLTDIGECRVAFATENIFIRNSQVYQPPKPEVAIGHFPSATN